MSRLVARILLSIFMFPLAAFVYGFTGLITVSAIEHFGQFGRAHNEEAITFILCGIVGWAFVASYWCLLWRNSVQWTSQRITSTVLAAFGALFVAGLIGVVTITLTGGQEPSIGIFFGGVLAIILWVVATVFIWRETTAERAQRVAKSSGSAVTCPTCGYNLTGLGEARCPECGSRFTLDELIAAQPNNRVEIE
jgi:heme A synthase